MLHESVFHVLILVLYYLCQGLLLLLLLCTKYGHYMYYFCGLFTILCHIIWSKLCSAQSASDKGTLFQLKMSQIGHRA